MAYKPVGADENGKFPPRVEAALSAAMLSQASRLRPLGGGADDAPQINAALNAARPYGAARTVVLEGDFIIGAHLAIPGNTTIDARAAKITAKANTGYLVQTKAMDQMLLAVREMTASAQATGGTLAAGPHFYKVSAVTTVGENIASLEFGTNTTGTTGSVALKWRTPRLGPTNTITHYKIWRGVGGAIDTLIATIPAVNPAFDQDVFWTDTGAVGTPGTPPVINTTFARTSGISIIGGVWDSNRFVNGAGGGWHYSRFVGHGFNLQKIDNTVLRDLTVKNAFKWAIAIADYKNLVTENLTFDTNSDGIHVLGPGKRWKGNGFYGHVGDDLVGISLVEWTPQVVSEGDITDVELSNFHGVDAPSAVRMLMGSGCRFDNIRISGVRGEYTFYRDAVTEAYTTPGVGVVFLNADQNNPGRKGGTFGSVIFDDIAPDSHKSDVLQVDGVGDSLVVKGLINRESSKYGARIGAPAFDANRPTTIKKLVVEDVQLKHQNAQRGVWVGQSNTTVEDAVINRPTSIQTVAGNSMLVEVNGCVVRRIKLTNPISTHTSANVMDVIQMIGATVDDLLISGVTADKINTLAYLNGGTYGTVTVSGGTFTTGQAVVKSKQPVKVNVRDLKVGAMSAGVVALFTGTATPVSVEYAGVTATASPGLSKDGSQVVTGKSLTTECDVSKLTKTANTMAYNTNAALSCGVGPVVCDGTNWKHLFTAATY